MSRFDAIYARQSVDRADSISIESQIDLCAREAAEGYRVYADRGYSGKDTDRPGWKALLADVRAGKVRRVVTYRLDRVSRSVLDFANIIDLFRQYGVSFSSTAEKFDTSHPVGNAMLMIVMVFAQLERETIQQRVADAYRDRSEKGFYMGGRVPYGFALGEGRVGGRRTRRYEPVEAEAETVRLIYRLYAPPEASFGDVARELDRLGLRDRSGRPFTPGRLRDLVRNPIYLRADLEAYAFFLRQGAKVHGAAEDFAGVNGCYLYAGQGKGRRGGSLSGSTLVLAPHQGLVDAGTWLQCREKCLSGPAAPRPQRAKNTWLAGRLKCARCGRALSAKLAPRKGKPPYAYLICHARYDGGGCPGVGALPLKEVERAVSDRVREKLRQFPVLRGEGPPSGEAARLRAAIEEKGREASGLVRTLPSLNGAAVEAVGAELNRLSEERARLVRALEELEERRRSGASGGIPDPAGRWDSLSFEGRRAVAAALLDRVLAGPEGLELYWRL